MACAPLAQVRARPMSAPVSLSWSSATSAVLPHTPAWPVQAVQLAVCSHWKQNISLLMDSFFLSVRDAMRLGVPQNGDSHDRDDEGIRMLV